MKRQDFFWEKTTRENEDMMCSHEYVKCIALYLYKYEHTFLEQQIP
jgi:hypothetical protein